MQVASIHYTAESTYQRVRAQLWRWVMPLLSYALLAMVGVGYWMWRGAGDPELSKEIWAMLASLLTFMGIITCGLVLAHFLWWLRVRSLRVQPGLALQLSQVGVQTEKRDLRWEEIASLKAYARSAGDGHVLLIAPHEGDPVQIEVDSLSVLPGTLDVLVRAHSNGRFGVDLAAYGV